MYPTPLTVNRSAPMISLAVTVVVVKSEVTALWTTVPTEIATPLVLIELETSVGIAVPLATFNVFTVAVPASTSILHPTIVQPKGTVIYPRIPVLIAAPPGVPNWNEITFPVVP
jgi:hypothetical protein